MARDKVKDLMVPIEEYGTVPEDATLYQAVIALEEAQKRSSSREFKHRAVLVVDASGRVVGKVSQLDVIRALDHRFRKLVNVGLLERFGVGQDVIKILTKELSLLENPLDDLCKKAAKIHVKEIMHSPLEGEIVDEDASLNEAIRQLGLGHHQSLLVRRGEDIVGILRLSDVYVEISQRIKACEL